MMAHEFRNILGPIRNSVEALRLREGLDDECRKLVDVVDRQSSRRSPGRGPAQHPKE
jgi:hypothetical protein